MGLGGCCLEYQVWLSSWDRFYGRWRVKLVLSLGTNPSFPPSLSLSYCLTPINDITKKTVQLGSHPKYTTFESFIKRHDDWVTLYRHRYRRMRVCLLDGRMRRLCQDWGLDPAGETTSSSTLNLRSCLPCWRKYVSCIFLIVPCVIPHVLTTTWRCVGRKAILSLHVSWLSVYVTFV